MPKQLHIDPRAVRAPGKLTFSDIELNTFQGRVKDVLDDYTPEALLGMYRDMVTIREFETMLNLIKTMGEYNGVAYDNPGPAHLSMGQEASAVGQAYILTVEDYILGSHRSHGEILAKGFSAIAKLSDDELIDVMSKFLGGDVLRVVERDKHDTVKELARAFLVYGALAEIFARRTGFNRGLGGSMHAFFIPFGIFPNNAIVGGSADIAAGAALYKRVNRKKGIVIANIGDGSMGCGPVYEAMNFAAMDQLRTLWDEGVRGGLPVLFNFFNNHYAMGGQTRGETMAYGVLARLGAGVTENQMHAERVDGYNPLAVIDAMRRKKAILEKGEGPVLLDVVTYRYAGHSPSDASTYRTKEEMGEWTDQDPLVAFRAELIEAGVATDDVCDAILARAKEEMTSALRLSINDELSPRIDLRKDPDAIAGMMFSNKRVEKFDERESELLLPLEQSPRAVQIAGKERFYQKDGKAVSKNKLYNYRDAVYEAMMHRFAIDPTMIAYGEENRDWGGAFGVYRGMTETLPYHRLFNSPISEAAIVGTAVGYAMSGGRSVVELMYCDFLGRAGDEVFNQLAKWQSMSANIVKMPVVLRVSVGSKYGAQHSQDWTSLVAHIPGLKVVFPVTPYDAKGLMNAALAGTDPVIFFESQRLYDIGEQFREGGVPDGYYEVPIGLPDVKKAGADVTILTLGAVLYRALDAAKRLESEFGLSAEIIDVRSLVPLDYEPILESVKKTGRLVLVSDACERGSFLHDIAQNVTKLAFDELDAPPIVIGARNWITPSYELDADFFPQAEWILDAINAHILPLPGYEPVTNRSDVELLRLQKQGI